MAQHATFVSCLLLRLPLLAFLASNTVAGGYNNGAAVDVGLVLDVGAGSIVTYRTKDSADAFELAAILRATFRDTSLFASSQTGGFARCTLLVPGGDAAHVVVVKQIGSVAGRASLAKAVGLSSSADVAAVELALLPAAAQALLRGPLEAPLSAGISVEDVIRIDDFTSVGSAEGSGPGILVSLRARDAEAATRLTEEAQRHCRRSLINEVGASGCAVLIGGRGRASGTLGDEPPHEVRLLQRWRLVDDYHKHKETPHLDAFLDVIGSDVVVSVASHGDMLAVPPVEVEEFAHTDHFERAAHADKGSNSEL